MKVDSHDAPPGSGTVKQAPDGERLQKALQEAEPRRPEAPPPRPGDVPGTPGPGAVRPGPGVLRPSFPMTARAAGPVLALARAALASPENLGRTRQVMHAEAQRLGTVRSEAGSRVQERTEHRLTELLARELSREAHAAPPRVSETRPVSGGAVPDASRSPAGAEPPAGDSRVTAAAAGGASPGGEVSPPTSAEAALELIERIEVFVKSQRPALSLSLRGTLDATVELERTGPREVALRIQGRRGPVPVEDLARLREALEARGLRLRSLRSE